MPVNFKPPRTVGQRAGMTRAKIGAAAVKLLRDRGPDGFTISALAKALHVVPTTIYAHFKGGAAELRKEIARVTIEALTPAYKPKQDPKNYLREFLRGVLESFRQSPHLGRLVLIELTEDPALSLTFLERMAMTIKALGGQDLIGGIELLVNRLSGLALIEMGKWARTKAEAQRTRLQVLLYHAPAAEFPTLKASSPSLGGGLGKRAAESYLQAQADRLAAGLMFDWKKGV